MRICVIGYSGAGKSTFAKALSVRLELPLLYLDRVQFTPGWVERDKSEALSMVDSFLHENEHWVIDGTYPSFRLEERLALSDHILLLDFDRFTCLRQALRRYRTFHGKVRESAADGCTEKMDFEFLRWLLWDGRTRQRAAAFQAIAEIWPKKTVIFKHPRQVNDYLNTQVPPR